MRALVAVVAGALALAAAAAAHQVAPEELVAALSTPGARASLGIERAERDVANRRVLLVRVGPRWFELPPGRRGAVAHEWWTAWRHAVPQGVVAVLDTRSDRPVVRYGRDGAAAVTPSE